AGGNPPHKLARSGEAGQNGRPKERSQVHPAEEGETLVVFLSRARFTGPSGPPAPAPGAPSLRRRPAAPFPLVRRASPFVTPIRCPVSPILAITHFSRAAAQTPPPARINRAWDGCEGRPQMTERYLHPSSPSFAKEISDVREYDRPDRQQRPRAEGP